MQYEEKNQSKQTQNGTDVVISRRENESSYYNVCHKFKKLKERLNVLRHKIFFKKSSF